MTERSPHSTQHDWLVEKVKLGIMQGVSMPMHYTKYQQEGLHALRDLVEQFETVRKMVDRIIERDDICPLCEWIPGTREEERKHYDYCPFGVPYPATKPERDCECDRRGLSKDDECIYELPCTNTEPGRDLNPTSSPPSAGIDQPARAAEGSPSGAAHGPSGSSPASRCATCGLPGPEKCWCGEVKQ